MRMCVKCTVRMCVKCTRCMMNVRDVHGENVHEVHCVHEECA